MDNNAKLFLISQVQALETAKAAIETQLTYLHSQLSESPLVQTQPQDPSVLGYDTMGRVIRRRNISPEVAEQRRQLIAQAREKRMALLRGEQPAEKEKAVEAPAVAVQHAGPAPKKGN